MLDLGRCLREQGADYPSFQEKWKRPMNQWTFETHIVNLCMMLKYEALCSALLGEEYTDQAEALWQVLEKHNGTAAGVFTGDECLSGLGNQQGTELCAVVELMYACEWLYALTGDSKWAERLEKAAFNALPATFSDDMWTHQYDQMANQVACIKFPGKSFFRTNNGESHLFGLEPNYGCCTANFSQGWPKLALHALQRTERGLLVAHWLPLSADVLVNGQKVHLSIRSDYPFRMGAQITVSVPEKTAFELKLRIPSWAKKLRVNGHAVSCKAQHLTLQKEWQGTETLVLAMETAPRLVDRPHRLKAVEYGTLVFALPIAAEYRMLEFTRDDVERKYPYCDYELIPQSAWNYGFADKTLTVEEKEISAIPFSATAPALCIHVSLAPVQWEWADGYDTVPAVRPASAKGIGPVAPMVLIPYGCAKLRMTEMPMVRA